MSVTVCKPFVEFVVAPATMTTDAICAPVASVTMFFSPAVDLADLDVNGTLLQAMIVAAIVNQTELRLVLCSPGQLHPALLCLYPLPWQASTSHA